MRRPIILPFIIIIFSFLRAECQHFSVESTDAAHIASFNGSPGMFIIFEENGLRRGYIGSYTGNAEDFDLGTSTQNPTGNLNLTIKGVPKLMINENGHVSIVDLMSTNEGPVYSWGDGTLFYGKFQYSMISATEFVGQFYRYSATVEEGIIDNIGPTDPVYAAVHHPDGADIQSIAITYRDSNSQMYQNITVSLKQKPYNSDASTALYSFTSSGYSGTSTDYSGYLTLNPIDNFNNVYFIEIDFPFVGPDTYGDVSIKGVRIYYTY